GFLSGSLLQRLQGVPEVGGGVRQILGYLGHRDPVEVGGGREIEQTGYDSNQLVGVPADLDRDCFHDIVAASSSSHWKFSSRGVWFGWAASDRISFGSSK